MVVRESVCLIEQSQAGGNSRVKLTFERYAYN
jgi:hypothetical protein